MLAAMASEKQRLDDAKVLKKQLDDALAAAPAAQNGDGDGVTAIAVLQEDEEAARGEVALAEEKERLLQAEVAELERQKEEALEQLQGIQEEHRQRLLPKIEELHQVRAASGPTSSYYIAQNAPGTV